MQFWRLLCCRYTRHLYLSGCGGTRTLDLEIKSFLLYQLSHTSIQGHRDSNSVYKSQSPVYWPDILCPGESRDDGPRTHDLPRIRRKLCQLSYIPISGSGGCRTSSSWASTRRFYRVSFRSQKKTTCPASDRWLYTKEYLITYISHDPRNLTRTSQGNQFF